MLINVTVGGVTEYLPNERTVQVEMLGLFYVNKSYRVPMAVGGEPAVMEANDLIKKIISFEDDVEKTVATEYWEGTELRHRSVDMHLKAGLSTLMEQASFG